MSQGALQSHTSSVCYYEMSGQCFIFQILSELYQQQILKYEYFHESYECYQNWMVWIIFIWLIKLNENALCLHSRHKQELHFPGMQGSARLSVNFISYRQALCGHPCTSNLLTATALQVLQLCMHWKTKMGTELEERLCKELTVSLQFSFEYNRQSSSPSCKDVAILIWFVVRMQCFSLPFASTQVAFRSSIEDRSPEFWWHSEPTWAFDGYISDWSKPWNYWPVTTVLGLWVVFCNVKPVCGQSCPTSVSPIPPLNWTFYYFNFNFT